jgi:hypothetical protein
MRCVFMILKLWNTERSRCVWNLRITPIPSKVVWCRITCHRNGLHTHSHFSIQSEEKFCGILSFGVENWSSINCHTPYSWRSASEVRYNISSFAFFLASHIWNSFSFLTKTLYLLCWWHKIFSFVLHWRIPSNKMPDVIPLEALPRDLLNTLLIRPQSRELRLRFVTLTL